MDEGIDAGNEVGASAAEGVEGSLLVVAVAASVGPAAMKNADPFERQGAHGGMVTFSFVALGLVEGLGPEGVFDRFGSPLMEGLPEEDRATWRSGCVRRRGGSRR